MCYDIQILNAGNNGHNQYMHKKPSQIQIQRQERNCTEIQGKQFSDTTSFIYKIN